MNGADYRVHLCFGPNCSRFNPKELLRALEEEVEAQGLEDKVSITLSACRNRCEQSPSLNVYPGPVFYNRLTPDAVRRIVRQHLTGGDPVADYVFRPGLKPTVPPRPEGVRRPAPAAPPARPAERKRRWWG
ncbi:MAG: (2Fe-2S) ferredoxin domain-containing protein [Chloroflexota bacterium]|nr:(2Fe-2S) ferredoxin domain-containing protein [Chloroflexota bacterium]